MLTISIIFALLVALWGFSGVLAASAKRSVQRAAPQERPDRIRAPAQRARGSRPGSRPVTSAGR